jgi:hypothetical protein
VKTTQQRRVRLGPFLGFSAISGALKKESSEMSDIDADKPRHKCHNSPPMQRRLPPNKIGWRIDEWSRDSGTSRSNTYRRIADGTLRTRQYGGVTLILGFAGDESGDPAE